MSVAIKRIRDGKYLGKRCKRGERQAVDDISKAKLYKSKNTAMDAFRSMGYFSSKGFEFIEVEDVETTETDSEAIEHDILGGAKKTAEQIVKILFIALQDASEHLEYCGYGDPFESECAFIKGIPETTNKALKLANEWINANVKEEDHADD